MEHQWVAAADLPLDERDAKRAVRHRRYVVPEQLYVVVREAFWAGCRLTFERSEGEPCGAGGSHLHGGPPDGTRPKSQTSKARARRIGYLP